MSAHPHDLSHCENCGVALSGAYCHACGQAVLSPVRHAGHAIEEVFEAFWHLDGRVFRTLRDLVFPGRVAINYLAGHRARYIAPLRLFVILSLLTFFVGRLTVHATGPAIQFDPEDSQFGRAQTVAEVEQTRERLLREVADAEREAAKVPGVNAALVAARGRIQGEAANRIAELRAAGAGTGTGAASPPAPPPASSPSTAPTRPIATPATPPSTSTSTPSRPSAPVTLGTDWDPQRDPIAIAWLPDFANRWLTGRAVQARDNLQRLGREDNAEALLQAFMGALPTALFVLVPVFALLLKLCYLGSRRLYLEHLVVALYSHAYMLLALLASFLLATLGRALTAAGWTVPLTVLATVALWCWVPVYLWRMQHRVYRQRWWITTLKYLVIGNLYLVLVSFAAAYAALAGIVGM